MRLHRFFLNYNPDEKFIQIRQKELIHQIKNVLKLKKGEEIIIFQNDLKEARSKIIQIGSNVIDLEILKIQENLREPKKEINLYCALLKKENFELMAQKATETGVQKIIPLITERTVKTNLNRNRLIKIIKEASEQSGRGIIPELEEIFSLEEAFKQTKEDLKLFFHIEGEKFDPFILKGKKRIAVFIGPEGGWSEKEKTLAKENNCFIVSLSSLTFRAETAAIIATYLTANF